MEKEFGTFKVFESSKDFMIVAQVLIKPLGYQNKLNLCFPSTFTEADSEPSHKHLG